jgi:hypothetical protein
VHGFDEQQYVVSSDSQPFPMNVITDQASTSPITVHVNWDAALKP